jgi:TRAP-type C4-dicarboxylate transport system substrate-binding protein
MQSLLNSGKKLLLLVVVAVLLSASFSFAADPIILKFSTQNAENAWSTQHGLKPWLKMIEDDSQGTIKFELYANQTLAKGNQNWMAVKNGIADCAWNSMSMYNGLNPLAEAETLPGLPVADSKQLVDRVWDMHESIPAAQKRYEDVKLLALYPSDNNSGMHFIKPVKTLEDLKGLKVHSFGTGPSVDFLKGLGATPVPMAMPDVYMALQKGTIEGCLADWDAYVAFRTYELAKYTISNAPLGTSHFSIIMNKDKFEALPQVAKDAILKHSGREGSRWLVENFSCSGRELAKDLIDQKKVEVYELPPAERARWVEACKPAWANWLEYAVSKGVSREDAQKALDIFTHP